MLTDRIFLKPLIDTAVTPQRASTNGYILYYSLYMAAYFSQTDMESIAQKNFKYIVILI